MRCAGRHWQVAEVCRLMMLLPLIIDQPKFQSRVLDTDPLTSYRYRHSLNDTHLSILSSISLKSLFSESHDVLLQGFSTNVERLRGHQIAVWGLPAPELKLDLDATRRKHWTKSIQNVKTLLCSIVANCIGCKDPLYVTFLQHPNSSSHNPTRSSKILLLSW